MARTKPSKKKNPAAVALGRLGGLKSGGIRNLPREKRLAIARKGGEARARKLSARELSAAGRKAILARWRKAKRS
jgi:hypothetical protein